MKTIQLTRGCTAIVDDADYPFISKFRWRAMKRTDTFYAVSSFVRPGQMVYMHRLLMGASAGVEIDHWDGDGLNNQRHNLRFADRVKQGGNTRLYRTNVSGFKGVRWTNRCKSRPWLGQITFQQKNKWLGYFSTPREAAIAYDKAALERFGEFARTNAILGLL